MNIAKKYTLLLTITLLMATAYIAIPTQAQAVTEWPMFMHDPAHTGYSTANLPETFMIGWVYRTGGMIRGSAAVSNGRVYVGSDDGWVYCVNVEDGTEIWKYETGGIVYSSAAVVGGSVFVGSGDGYVYAIDANSGNLDWSYETEGYIVSSPTVAGGIVYIGSSDNSIYALDATNGDLVWSYATDGPILHVSPAVVDGYVYIGGLDQYLYKLDAANGTVIWATHCVEGSSYFGFSFSSPMYAEGKIYIGADDYGMYCVDAESGNIDWWQRLSQGFANTYISSTPSYDGEKVYITAPYKLYAWDPDNPAIPLIDKQVCGNMIFTSPATADGKVFAGSRDLYFYMLDADTGDRIQSFRDPFSSPWSAAPALVDGKIIVGCYNWNLYCFVEGTQTSISRWVSPTTIMLGDSVDVGGGIVPAVSGATVTLAYSRPDLTEVTQTVTTGTDGTYASSFTPDVEGLWTLTASWAGSATHGQAFSRQRRITVEPVTTLRTTMSRWANPTTIAFGDSVDVGGGILPAVSGATVTLTYTRPDATTVTQTVTTGTDGTYADSITPDVEGLWTYKASWAGSATHSASTSAGGVFAVHEVLENGAQAEAGIPTEYIYAIVAVIAIAIVVIAAFLYMRRK
ncbi:MAG: PQQ-binding-like beta-propeller repeat protein [Candidatus Bathyarchaeota archaeon]|nr:PQQ-binding-like beta-propeller repeat protein [Candidatus Bathyarchaeota archaeon]MCZ2807730.1 PQQ-binding-like beta-propeller repeat protein [Candidatus Bathyarchaeota archaeon]